MNPTRRDIIKLTAAAPIYGLEPYPRTEEAIADHPPVLWETEAMLVPLPNRSDPHELGRGEGRRLFITAYADGSGRIAMSRVPRDGEPWSFQLFGDDRPFAATRIDPATFQALWIGLFAASIDEPMPAVGPA